MDAMETMQQKDIRRLPVVDSKGKLLGIVIDKDIFRAILKYQKRPFYYTMRYFDRQ
jgi:CBS domain-containing protein